MADAVRDGQIALALRLAKFLVPANDADADATATSMRNVAFSPLSVHAKLALLASGARGATQAQLLNFLGAPSADVLASFGRRVAVSVLANRPYTADGPHVLYGGGVWVDAACGRIKKAFRDVTTGCYKSEACTVSFAKEPEKAVEMINNRVKKATYDFFTSIISPMDINTTTDIVLADAVYFKGAWLLPFNSKSTESGTFHRIDGSCVTARFMYLLHHLQVSCVDGFKILKLRYKKGSLGANGTQYSMFLFLPDKRGGIAVE